MYLLLSFYYSLFIIDPNFILLKVIIYIYIFLFISIEQGNSESGGTQGDKLFRDEELVQLIDPILSMDDANNDGYIDYPEFIRAQQNAAASARP
jgi:hypothetical protein